MINVHHIGYVVANIDQYAKHLVLGNIIKRLYDKNQQAELALIKADNILIELITPKTKVAFTYDFLIQKGGGYHHLCYEVNSKAEAELIIKEKRMIKILGWIAAPLLESEVIFAYGRNKEIVEFVLCR